MESASLKMHPSQGGQGPFTGHRATKKTMYQGDAEEDVWKKSASSYRPSTCTIGTALTPDECANARAHQRVARLCTEACDPRVSAEALYHRYCAEQRDEVLALARPAVLRAQFRQLRSPALIREDISLAMKVAADRGDVLTTVRLLLSMSKPMSGSRRLKM